MKMEMGKVSVTEYRVVVAISDPMLRALLVAQVEQVGHTVIGEADSPEAVLRLCQAQRPDAVVIHWLSIGIQGGESLCPRLSELNPAMKMVTLVDGQQPHGRIAALATGAWACVVTPHTTMDVMAALEQDRQVVREQAEPPRAGPVREEPAPEPVSVHASAARSAGMSFLKRAV
jgi:DNA-binding NarL/FixJ family response regulator